MLVNSENYGAALLKLRPKQREFVLAFVANPGASHAAVARLAGYSDVGDGAKVVACRMLQDEKILAALHELLDKSFRSDAVFARGILLEIAADERHPAAARLRAAEALLNRRGFAAEQKIRVEHSDTSSEEMIERIKRLATELNLPADKLLGGNTHAMKLIEGQVIDAEPAPMPAPVPADSVA
jgi:hypothetical protein